MYLYNDYSFHTLRFNSESGHTFISKTNLPNTYSKSFEIKEELAPNGHTHGGFGFVDSKGDLVFTEYAKDAQGQL